jgi:sarcosine oxidase subunit beta
MRADETVGHPAGYRPQGYLFLATDEKHLSYLRANYALQVSLGLNTVRLIDTTEIVRMVPQLRADDILGGSFCSTDGFVDPYSVMVGFITRAVERGARLWRDTDVTGLVLEAEALPALKSRKAASRTVVNAAGAWAARVAAFAGVDLPVEPLRRMLVPTEPFPLISREAPWWSTCRMAFTSVRRAQGCCWPGTIGRNTRLQNEF